MRVEEPEPEISIEKMRYENSDTFNAVGPAVSQNHLVSHRESDFNKSPRKGFSSNSVLFGNHFPDEDTKAQREQALTVSCHLQSTSVQKNGGHS